MWTCERRREETSFRQCSKCVLIHQQYYQLFLTFGKILLSFGETALEVDIGVEFEPEDDLGSGPGLLGWKTIFSQIPTQETASKSDERIKSYETRDL